MKLTIGKHFSDQSFTGKISEFKLFANYFLKIEDIF